MIINLLKYKMILMKIVNHFIRIKMLMKINKVILMKFNHSKEVKT